MILEGAPSSLPAREVPQAPQGSIWGVTVFFNPAGYVSKLANLRYAIAAFRRQGLAILAVEGVFEQDAFSLSPEDADSIVQVRLASRLWQKERRLNIGIEALPSQCDSVVWLDSDILFSDDQWVGKALAMLQRFVVIQPYRTAYWLEPGVVPVPPIGGSSVHFATNRTAPSAAFSESRHPHTDYPRGHTGFAWAARRDALCGDGLYDRMILGGADTIIASSMYGLSAKQLLESYCTPGQALHISQWMERFHRKINGSVGFLDGDLCHLWHGSRQNRQYEARHNILIEEEFDPCRDVSCTQGDGLSWSSDKPDLHRRVMQYFYERKEDDTETCPAK